MTNDDDGDITGIGRLSGLDEVTEQRRLEATALVASRVSREETQIGVRKERLASQVRDMVILFLVVAVAVLAWRNAGESRRTKQTVIRLSQENCRQYRDVASIPIIPSTTVVGLRLVADFRNSYYAFECNKHGGPNGGPLPPADPKLVPYLTPQAR